MHSDKDQAKASAPASRDPQQRASAQELESIIQSLPLTDYSDYTINVEQKTEFSDALFANEQELEQALSQGLADKQAADMVSDPQATDKPEAVASPALQFDRFISTASSPTKASLAVKTPTLSLIGNTLNGSPARKVHNKTIAAESFHQHLAAISERNHPPSAVAVNTTASLAAASDKPGGESQLSALTAIFKAKTLSLSKKSRAKLEQSKAELDEYLGRSLPARTVPLDFMLSAITSKPADHKLLSEQNIRQLFSVKGKPLPTVLGKCEEQLLLVTKAQLACASKLQLLDLYYSLASEKIKAVIAMYERKPVAFDDSKRIAISSLALSIMKLLVIGYKQAYSEFYQSSNLHYGTHRNTVRDCAFALIDCLSLELRLTVGLHCPPATAAVKTINKLFYVLSLYEPEWLDTPHYSRLVDSPASINTLYKRYHLTLLLDTKTLSSQLHKALFSYLGENAQLATLLPVAVTSHLDELNAGPLKPGQQLLCIRQDEHQAGTLIGPAMDIPADTSQTVLMLPGDLLNRFKLDYVSALKARISGRQGIPSSLLKTDNDEQALTILAMLNLSVRNSERHQASASYTLYQAVNIKAYSGLQSCGDFLRYHCASQMAESSEYSTTESQIPRPPAASKCQWLSAGEDQASLYLQCAEDRLGIALDIGQLALFVYAEEDTLEPTPAKSGRSPNEYTARWQLTRISRLERDPKGNISLTADKLAAELTHIELIQPNGDRIAAIIARNEQQRLLITAVDQHYHSLQPVSIAFPDQSSATLVIAGLLAINSELQILQLTP